MSNKKRSIDGLVTDSFSSVKIAKTTLTSNATTERSLTLPDENGTLVTSANVPFPPTAVTTNTNQTITGKKTITADFVLSANGVNGSGVSQSFLNLGTNVPNAGFPKLLVLHDAVPGSLTQWRGISLDDTDIIYITNSTPSGHNFVYATSSSSYATMCRFSNTQAIFNVPISTTSSVAATTGLTLNGVNVATVSDIQTLTNKNLTSGTNTFPSSLATLTGTQALTNKDLTSGTNTFPTSLATLTGVQALTNKDLSSGTNTFPSTLALKSQFYRSLIRVNAINSGNALVSTTEYSLGTFTANGGPLLIQVSHAAYITGASSSGYISIVVKTGGINTISPTVTSTSANTVNFYFNNANVHHTLPMVQFTIASGYTTGSQTVYLRQTSFNGYTSSGDDTTTVMITEFPA